MFQSVDGNANISANFIDVDTGDYEFEFEVIDSGTTDTSAITVTEKDDVDAQTLCGGVATAVQGDFVAIPLQLEEVNTTTVNLGFNDVKFNVTFEIEDDNDNGIVMVEVNSYLAGRYNALPAYLRSITSATNANSRANDTLASALTTAENQDDVTASGSGLGMRPLGADDDGVAGNSDSAGISGPMEPASTTSTSRATATNWTSVRSRSLSRRSLASTAGRCPETSSTTPRRTRRPSSTSTSRTVN